MFICLNLLDNSQVENSREEVFTFYNSKSFKSDVGCIILNLRNNTRKRLSYCLDLDKCGQELPYICKLKKDITSQQRYYKHSLENYQQDPKMSYIMNAFLAVVYGLNNAQKNVNILFVDDITVCFNRLKWVHPNLLCIL